MSKVAHFGSLIKLLFQIFLKLKQQKRLVRQLLNPTLNHFKLKDDGSISSYDYYKISHYYGVGVPVLAGGIFDAVFNEKLDSKSRKAMTYMAAVTGLFDDFFDKTNHDKESLLSMMSKPELHNPGNTREGVFISFTLKALQKIDNKDAINSSKLKVFEVQWESKLQQEKGRLTWDQLKDLSLRKGGLSLLFYASGAVGEVSDSTKELLMKIGGLLQYGNDIFDLYKDKEEGVDTHINTAEDMQPIKKDFESTLQDLFLAIKKLGLGGNQEKELKKQVLVFSCRALVCLDQYLRLQETTKNKFVLDNYSRKQLICDMEKPGNLLKAINYYVNLL
jgi:hypothetical protein